MPQAEEFTRCASCELMNATEEFGIVDDVECENCGSRQLERYVVIKIDYFHPDKVDKLIKEMELIANQKEDR